MAHCTEEEQAVTDAQLDVTQAQSTLAAKQTIEAALKAEWEACEAVHGEGNCPDEEEAYVDAQVETIQAQNDLDAKETILAAAEAELAACKLMHGGMGA